MSYQKTTGPLMANSHPGSYSGQDAYQDMLVTESAKEQNVEVLEREGEINSPYGSERRGGAKDA